MNTFAQDWRSVWASAHAASFFQGFTFRVYLNDQRPTPQDETRGLLFPIFGSICSSTAKIDDSRNEGCIGARKVGKLERKRHAKKKWHVRQVEQVVIFAWWLRHIIFDPWSLSFTTLLALQAIAMATPRLPPFYANLFRAIKSCQPNTYRSLRQRPQSTSRQGHLHTSRRVAQDTFTQRYGPAASSNLPPPPKPSEPLLQGQEQPAQKEAAEPERKQEDATTNIEPSKETESSASEDPASSKEQSDPVIGDGEPLQNKELDMVLSIPSPSEMKGKANRPHPHLEASPYEHHFDTYSLVQQLASEGFSQEQAVTLMKAIRLMLAVNLDVAKESLVSKSDTENETYLFRAACSELRTTLQTARQSEIQKQRSTRAQLQHEADILSQKVTQDIKSLQEELKGMFNDRKMSLEEDRRRVNSKISELNYEITVLLNSDSKSEVEGLRWVLTRRAALAIAAAACEFLLMFSFWIYANRANSHGPFSTQLFIHQGARAGRHGEEA